MKNKGLHRFFPLLLVAGLNGYGQTPYDPQMSPAAFLIRDQLEVFTDRDLYCAGESVQFRVDCRTEGIPSEPAWSRVVYMELVNAAGRSVLQKKYELEPGPAGRDAGGILSGTATGSFKIPEGTATGNYLLKSYTRWMRNRGPGTFSYLPVKIFNPMNSEVIQPNHDKVPSPVNRREYVTGYVDCTTGKPVYHGGDTVDATLGFRLPAHVDSISFCVSVVPEGTLDPEWGQYLPGTPAAPAGDFRVEYLPDLKGVSFSGRVVYREEEGHPVPDSRVYFALLGNHPDIYSLVTDGQGRFAVALPDRKGTLELFVAQDPALAEDMEVRVDQDFDGDPLPVLPGSFFLDSLERRAAEQISINRQLNKAYRKEATQEERVTDSTVSLPFYGTPGFSILMDDFVKLPTLEEVMVNLVPGVEVVSRRNRRYMRFLSANGSISLYPPLILIDHIPVFDHQAVLRIDPGRIYRIDLVDQVYVKGDFFHGGVLSILSRQGDMAGIDLPKGSYFFDFQSIEDVLPEPAMDYGPGDRIPDMRNTVYWESRRTGTEGAGPPIMFKAPRIPGTYMILVRGLAHSGSVLCGKCFFTVQK